MPETTAPCEKINVYFKRQRKLCSFIFYGFLKYLIKKKFLIVSCSPPNYWPNIEIVELNSEVYESFDLSAAQIDMNSTVIIDNCDAFLLGLQQNHMPLYLSLKLQTDIKNSGFVNRIVRVQISLQRINSTDVIKIYATRQFIFNAIKHYGLSQCSLLRLTSYRIFDINQLPTAHEIQLVRLQSNDEAYSEAETYYGDKLLREHFFTTRLLNKGDVFLICANVQAHYYFKVAHLFGINSSSTITDLTSSLVSWGITKCSLNGTQQGGDCIFGRRISLEFLPASLRKCVKSTQHFFKANQESKAGSASCLISIPESIGAKQLFLNYLADEMRSRLFVIDCNDLTINLTENASLSTRNTINERIHSVFQNDIVLQTLEQALNKIDNHNEKHDGRSITVGVVITCTPDELFEIPARLGPFIHKQINVDELKAADRQQFFHAKLRRLNWLNSADLQWFMEKTKSFTLTELEQVVNDVCESSALMRYQSSKQLDVRRSDFEESFSRRNAVRMERSGAPKVPTVRWQDVGGLENVKSMIIESIRSSGFYSHNEAQSETLKSSWKRSGILLYGPPGCGKTLIAKAVANQFDMTFLSIKGPELLNQYVGQSEKNLRDVFAKAKAAAPAILFFDELDSMASSRGSTGDSGGVMDRMVSQLLAEMDAIKYEECEIFVMAATNRPDLLDPSLMMPGRFDKSILIEPARNIQSKLEILESICRRANFENEFNAMDIAEMCPEQLSGAELHALVSNSTMIALREVIERLEATENNRLAAKNCDRYQINDMAHDNVDYDSDGKEHDETDRRQSVVKIKRLHVEQALSMLM